MKATQITWTRTEAGRYTNPDTGIEIRQGESGRWFVYEGDKLVRSAAKLSLAKVAAKPIVLRALELAARVAAAQVEALRMEADRIVEQGGGLIMETVKLAIHIEIDVHDDAADTGLTVEKWNALTDAERSAIYRDMWKAMAESDNGGVTVITDGATEV